MKVLLIKDVYKLGRAGEIKKVAAGYGRNYLIPRGFAIPATPGSMQQAERISVKATELRAALNEELSDVATVLNGKALVFPVKAGETGRLYGSVSSEDIIKTIHENYEIELEKRQVEMEPIRQLGTYSIPVHLTMDLVPEISVIIHREGELPGEEQDAEDVPEAAEEATADEMIEQVNIEDTDSALLEEEPIEGDLDEESTDTETEE
ncbi:MAG: 50S ribosomal protein L9 [Chloroflexota bacterium]|nr:50S ribosomal protein L9 [Chloroflexota bacterium]